MTLAGLRRGQTAIIREIRATAEHLVRLMEMGLTPGTQVKLTGIAPLGDPLRFSVRGYDLSVRRGEAAEVQVDLVEALPA